jgi:hypothetical protein
VKDDKDDKGDTVPLHAILAVVLFFIEYVEGRRKGYSVALVVLVVLQARRSPVGSRRNVFPIPDLVPTAVPLVSVEKD